MFRKMMPKSFHSSSSVDRQPGSIKNKVSGEEVVIEEEAPVYSNLAPSDEDERRRFSFEGTEQGGIVVLEGEESSPSQSPLGDELISMDHLAEALQKLSNSDADYNEAERGEDVGLSFRASELLQSSLDSQDLADMPGLMEDIRVDPVPAPGQSILAGSLPPLDNKDDTPRIGDEKVKNTPVPKNAATHTVLEEESKQDRFIRRAKLVWSIAKFGLPLLVVLFAFSVVASYLRGSHDTSQHLEQEIFEAIEEEAKAIEEEFLFLNCFLAGACAALEVFGWDETGMSSPNFSRMLLFFFLCAGIIFKSPPPTPPNVKQEEEPSNHEMVKSDGFYLDVSKYEIYTVAQLRKLLEDRKCCANVGRKYDLIERLVMVYTAELQCMTVKHLRQLLWEKDLKQSGRKADMIRRLVEAGLPECP